MSLRRLLLRFLLATVFLHTVVAVPLHEAGHLREALAPQTLVELATAADREHGEDGQHSATVCAWSMVHAGLAGPDAPPRGVATPQGEPTHARPQRCIGAPTGEGRWPFAARDPPHALS
ncbi:hypothetical protein [Pseudorhodoferax sp. Leaf267]|uniref:hypothetical protein n=1 Tax=Pseudorhodoferax sp. Leaf267 TaxID=1736316 RepID=UPI0007148A6D|nr:hypothetical protein [Pseudorhodoferax sp. Leaf267]KQP22933.1 hypothetical protein ASF43_03300 [Pseudorhodoferax sp. Leaf267]